MFDDVTLHLPNGKSFRIAAHHRTSQPLHPLVTLNGKPLNRFWLRHTEIAAGGELLFDMSHTPSNWPIDTTAPER